MKPEEALNHEWIKEGMISVKSRQLRHKAAASERKRGELHIIEYHLQS